MMTHFFSKLIFTFIMCFLKKLSDNSIAPSFFPYIPVPKGRGFMGHLVRETQGQYLCVVKKQGYIKEHKPKLGMVKVNTSSAGNHLTSIEQEVEQRMDALLPQMMKAAGVTEELKAHNQMPWVG